MYINTLVTVRYSSQQSVEARQLEVAIHMYTPFEILIYIHLLQYGHIHILQY